MYTDIELGSDLHSPRITQSKRLGVDEINFLRAYTGSNIDHIQKESADFLRHLSCLITIEAQVCFRSSLDPTFEPLSDIRHRILMAMYAMVANLRNEPSISVSGLLGRLLDDGVFRLLSDQESETQAKHCLLSMLGWCSLLFIPLPMTQAGIFDVQTQGVKCISRPSLSLEHALRPVDELLRSLGDLLPKKRVTLERDTRVSATHADSNVKFHVSKLNAATLDQIAQISIVWVDSVSGHLDFDPSGLPRPTLCLFKAPSYCKLHESKDSFLDLLTKDFYTAYECPIPDFAYRNLMTEILRTYQLLFHDWALARRQYRSKERAKARIDGAVDPLLDRVCGMEEPANIFSSWISNQGVRETYDASTQFPILKEKLQVVQDYVDGIQPSRFQSLWRDRRDLRLWYTIWVVIILGVISVILAIIADILAAAQVVIAWKSYQLQRDSA